MMVGCKVGDYTFGQKGVEVGISGSLIVSRHVLCDQLTLSDQETQYSNGKGSHSASSRNSPASCKRFPTSREETSRLDNEMRERMKEVFYCYKQLSISCIVSQHLHLQATPCKLCVTRVGSPSPIHLNQEQIF